MSEENQHIEEQEPSSAKLVLALGIAGLLSGFVLVGTFLFTNPYIKANQQAAIERAILNVIPNCDSFSTLVLTKSGLEIKNTDNNEKEEADKEELLIYAGFNLQGGLIGFAIPGSEPGFQDVISSIYGYNNVNKTIIGFEVLESKETPGLGDKIIKDQDFQVNFKSLSVEPEIITVKKGEKENKNEVEAISGATISSKAIVRLLNKSIALWQPAIDQYVNDNNIEVTK